MKLPTIQKVAGKLATKAFRYFGFNGIYIYSQRKDGPIHFWMMGRIEGKHEEYRGDVSHG